MGKRSGGRKKMRRERKGRGGRDRVGREGMEGGWRISISY